VLEDLPDDGGIMQCGDQAQRAPTLRTRQHVDAEGLAERRPGFVAAPRGSEGS